jgi:hypothetical protein
MVGSFLGWVRRFVWVSLSIAILWACDGGGGEGGAGGTAGSGGNAGSAGALSDGAGGSGGSAGSDGGDGASPLPAPGPDPNAVSRLAAALQAPCGPESTDAAIEALARAGIGTHDDVTGALLMETIPPTLGLRALRLQARGMGCEIASRGGTTGAMLNQMMAPLPLPDGSQLPFSALVAAYAVTPGRFGSELTAALMGSVDPKAHASLTYPSIVLALFTRDVIVPMLAEAPLAQELAKRVRAVDPCGALGEFLDDLPGAVSNAVSQLGSDDGGFWSTVVSVAATAAGLVTYGTVQAAKALVQHLPFVEAIRAAATAGAAVADLRSMFTQWTVAVTPAPGSVHKTVDGPPNTGKLVVTVTPPSDSFSWPPQVESCADLFGIPLPNFDSADGSSVIFTELAGFPAPATQISASSSISGSSAELTYQTVTETQSAHTGGGPEKSTPATVKVDIGLPGLESLGQSLGNLMNAPGAGAAIGAGAAAAAQLIGPSGTGSAQITYHDEVAATLDVLIADGGGFFDLHLVSCSGKYGPYNGTATVGPDPSGSSPATLSIDPTSQDGTFAVGIGLSGSCTGQYDVNSTVTLGGSATAPTATFAGQVTGFIACPGGGGPLNAAVSGTYPVVLGPAPECP